MTMGFFRSDWRAVLLSGCVLRPGAGDAAIEECELLPWKCPSEDISYWLSNKEIGQLSYELKLDADKNLTKAPFSKSKQLVILIHGYTGNRWDPPNPQLVEAYLNSGDNNIVTVDWEKGARAPCYVQAARNVELVSQCTVELISGLYKYHPRIFNVKRTHVIGFSLGAHVAGSIGKRFKMMFRRRLPRITGLDPALPLFDTVFSSRSKSLDRTDGRFVDVIHTNAGVKGLARPMGHVDFYMNNGGTQPGCDDSACNHERAVEVFAESIETKIGFWGARCMINVARYAKKCGANVCTSYTRKGGCPVLMGEHVNWRSRGTFMVKTHYHPPYARGRFIC